MRAGESAPCPLRWLVVNPRFLFYGELLLRVLPEEDYALHLEALAEALPLEVAATDALGHVIVWNAALARVAGPRERALGRPLLDALPWLAEDSNLDWHRMLAQVLAGEGTVSLARVPLGERVVRVTLSPMRGGGGSVLGAVLSMEDITQGARALEQRRLQDRQAAVHDLGASIAHEIRNPLNALSLNLQLLEDRVADADVDRGELAERTAHMIDEVTRMERLIRHLLEVARRGNLSLSSERIDPLAMSVLKRLEGVANQAGCVVRFEPDSHRLLQLDRLRIERALENLVRNAVEAAAEGGRHVWVTTRDDPHSTVLVVDDDGPGIRPEDRSEVFGLHRTSKRGGSGLGLPLAQEDVARHGGAIEVLARPGGGARFVMHLPLDVPVTPCEDAP